MAMFDQPFREHIQTELKHRRKFDNVKTVLHPHVRVTSLVGGTLKDVPIFNNSQELNGFTLGVPDVNKVNTLGTIFICSYFDIGTKYFIYLSIVINLSYRNSNIFTTFLWS